MKIGIFYTPDKADVLTFATEKDHAEFGKRLEKHANHLAQLALDRCRSVVSLTDGAPWIRNRILDHIPYVSAMLLEYPQALSRGWDIGSGPTEALCKNLTLRLKRTGMKWDPANAEALMTLAALRESGQWDRYRQSAAA